VYGELLDASHHVYGEVVDASHQARRSGLAIHESGWMQLALLDHLAQIWQEPDRGIWEVRGSPQRFTHSGVMAWVAFHRAIRSAEMFDLDGPIDRWRQVRADIHANVCAHGFNAEIGSFVQCYGSARLDASLLLLPAVGFLPTNDERVRGTIAAIERHLLVDGLSDVDGLSPGEGAFLACSFWLADVYVLQNRGADAINLFRRLVSLCNEVGLLSEEYDTRSGRLVGNFPQAFSHLALVNTAFNLTGVTKPIEQRAQAEIEKMELAR
jgi:GH15 family glucan-1,4-alpha-glucosidase